MKSLNIIYMDNHLLVVNKPAGLLIQGDRTGEASLLDISRLFIKAKFSKPGNVYLGLVHRLDRPVSGVTVFARTSKAASRLSEQFRKREVVKMYWALVEGKTPDKGNFEDRIFRDGTASRIGEGENGSRPAELGFRRLNYKDGISLVAIRLETGRHHQIRVQFSSRGFPLLGDMRYGSNIKFTGKNIALHARSLSFEHPTRRCRVDFQALPGDYWMEIAAYRDCLLFASENVNIDKKICIDI